MDIARKYAHAFFAVYGDKVTDQLIDNIDEAAQFLATHHRAIFLFKVPLIDRSVKIKGIQELCKRFSLGEPIEALLIILLDAHRSSKFVLVLRALTRWYRKKYDIVFFAVSSSIPLSGEQRRTIEEGMNHKVSGNARYEYVVDPFLIAGVRICSDTLLWEFSIAKQLRDLYHSAIW